MTNVSNEQVKQVLVVELAGYEFTPQYQNPPYNYLPATDTNQLFLGTWGTELLKKQIRIPVELLKDKFKPNAEGKITEENLTELNSLIDGMLYPCCFDTGKIWPAMQKMISSGNTKYNWAAYAKGAETHQMTYTLWLETVNEEPLVAE